MDKKISWGHPRQQKFDFVGGDLWQRFSRQARGDCEELLTHLLVEITHEDDEEGYEDER